MNDNPMELSPECVDGLKTVLHKLDQHINRTKRITEALRKYKLANEETIAQTAISIRNNPDHPLVARLETLIAQYEEEKQ